MTQTRRRRRGAGGSATQAGMDYQNRVAAWIAVHVLAGEAATPPWELPADTYLTFVRCETEQPVDDVLVETSAGGFVFIQVKHTLTLDRTESSDFASTIDQYLRQFHSFRLAQGSRPWERPLDATCDRLVLVVGPRSSATIRDHLPSALMKVRALAPGQFMEDAATNDTERRVLHVLLQHLRRVWQEVTGTSLSEREARQVLALMRVVTQDVERDGVGEREAKDRLRSIVLREAKQADVAWNTLIQLCANLAKNRGTADRLTLRRALEEAAIELKVPGSYQTDILAGNELRRARLQELGRTSKGRCIRRWQALGVPRSEAARFADDLSIGAPVLECQPNADTPLRLLVADVGAGKTLMAERLFQASVLRASADPAAPVPVYQEARILVGPLRTAIERVARDLGDPSVQGAAVIIDGVDEAGISRAAELLNDARGLVWTWPNTTIVLTSRPIPLFTAAAIEEAVKVPLLSESQADALIRRVAGRHWTPHIMWQWPESVKDAIRRPLFAVLMATYLRDGNNDVLPRSTGELLHSLVERAIDQVSADRIQAEHLLQQLARLSMDRGGGLVPKAEVAPKMDLQPLLETGLVVQQADALQFPLPILTEWFAAHSLANGLPTPDELVNSQQRLEHWRYALIIFASIFDHDTVSTLLSPIAERHPAFAAQIVHEGLAQWGLAPRVSPPPALESGRRIRVAMQAWVNGLGPLARVIAPVSKNGPLHPIGIRVSDCWVITSWYQGKDDLPAVVELPGGVVSSGSTRLWGEWPSRRAAQPGRQSAWAWRWTHEELVSALSTVLQRRELPINSGPLAREAVWQAALAITNRGLFHPGPIPVSEIVGQLGRYRNSAVLHIGGLQLNQLRLEQLQEAVDRLLDAGAQELRNPWSEPTFSMGSGRIQAPATHEKLLARAMVVYRVALDAYRDIVDRWFPNFASSLQIAVTLPARLIGGIIPPTERTGLGRIASINWHLEPLPSGSESSVDLGLGEHHLDDALFAATLTKLRSLRPDASTWITVTSRSPVLDIFRATSVTELVYTWLWDDLQRVGWVNGHLGSPR